MSSICGCVLSLRLPAGAALRIRPSKETRNQQPRCRSHGGQKKSMETRVNYLVRPREWEGSRDAKKEREGRRDGERTLQCGPVVSRPEERDDLVVEMGADLTELLGDSPVQSSSGRASFITSSNVQVCLQQGRSGSWEPRPERGKSDDSGTLP